MLQTGSDADAVSVLSADEENSRWRDELSQRLNHYRSRRKMRPPRYPSLRLQFDAVAPLSGSHRGDEPQGAPATFEPVSDRALALDEKMARGDEVDAVAKVTAAAAEDRSPTVRAGSHAGAKIIEFPRFAFDQLTLEPPAAPLDQLAEPVMARPRILEVPEVELAQPALGGITIEPVERQELQKQPGIDIPLQSASLARRIVASAVDGLIVGTASALFGYIFWEVAGIRSPIPQMLGLAAGLLFVFWASYQYLLLIYAGTTPGLRAGGLELARFDGTGTNRSLRRWRVLASYLSAVSLGMGYAWVFLDEDLLCWHDRITRTYLAPRKRVGADGVPGR